MERLEPIPSPPGHLAREFCHRAVPLLAFCAALLGTSLLWNQRFTGTQLFGEVEPIRANVTTLEGGTLVELNVDRLQTVTSNQVLGVIQLLDPDSFHSELALARSEIQVLKSRIALDETRNDQNVESLRAQWLEARVDLATARVNFEGAKRDLERARRLRSENIMSEAEFDGAESLHDALAAEVRERTEQVAGIDASIRRLGSGVEKDQGGALAVLSDSLRIQEQRLQQQQDQKLRAPMDGIVKAINHRPGERVPAGAIVAVITAPHSERIIGYVRQPLNIEPRPGMPVVIRTRGPHPQSVRSKVLEVGSDLELVASPLRLRGFDNATERGLAFFVSLPPELKVHPGELVDLVLQHDSRP
ncbi:MAG: HlyD family efflux transporter periplasmic adaptor subunit [Verrucomicrobiales bacterium]|nr:HlyD family efflux transporter periplasmic adaptor subunit [Verrucomicrobiales bacterium]